MVPPMLVPGLFARCLGLGGLAVLPLLSGCASKVNHIRTGSAVVDPTLGLTVLFSRALAPGTGQGLGKDAADCVTSAIANNAPKVRLIAAEQFQRSVFPDLSLESLPVSRESLVILGKDETFRGRAAAAGIRFLIAVGGGTDQRAPWGDGTCAAGAGCIGFWLLERDSTLWAEILDMASGESVAKVEAKVSGHPWLGVLVVFPLGAPSFTETWACHKLGRSVVEFLTTQEDRSP